MGDRLSTGDAVAVVGLLGFITGWVALWCWGADWGGLRNASTGTFAVAVVLLLAIVGGPCLWAAKVIEHIVDRASIRASSDARLCTDTPARSANQEGDRG